MRHLWSSNTLYFSVDPDALLVESDNLASDQRVLERITNDHDLQAQLERQGNRLVLKDRVDELICLKSKCMLETVPVLGVHLVPDTLPIADLDLVHRRHQVDVDLALCANDLSRDVMSMSLRPAAVEVGNLSTPELDNTNAIVNIVAFGQLRVMLQGSDRPA